MTYEQQLGRTYLLLYLALASCALIWAALHLGAGYLIGRWRAR